MPQNIVLHETEIKSPKTVVDWYNFCRDLCGKWLDDNPIQIGGIDENWESKIVEIDESLFSRRKYHRGALRGQQQWVFGGIERNTDKC